MVLFMGDQESISNLESYCSGQNNNAILLVVGSLYNVEL